MDLACNSLMKTFKNSLLALNAKGWEVVDGIRAPKQGVALRVGAGAVQSRCRARRGRCAAGPGLVSIAARTSFAAPELYGE